MKCFTTIGLLLLLSCTTTHAQTVNETDSLEIVSKISDWNKGWKIKDYIPATKWYTGDAEFTNAFGQHRIGQPAIEALLKEVFQLPFVMAGDSKVISQTMMLVAPGVMLVITVIARAGQQTPDNKDLNVRHTTHHRLLKKEKEWLMAAHLISDARDTQAAKH